MLLTADVGNTITNIGVFDKDKLIYSDMFETGSYHKYSELSYKLLKMQKTYNFKSVSICCVVAKLTEVWRQACEILNLDYFNLSNKNVPKNLFDNQIQDPNEVGADIIAACVGARAKYGNSLLVCDLGTATNLNIIDKNGAFIGCYIMPGILTSLRALVKNASALDSIEIKEPENVIGKNTEETIRSGLVFGEAGKIEHCKRRTEEELGYKFKLIVTGGWGCLISKFLYEDSITDKSVILYGLNLIYEQVRGN